MNQQLKDKCDLLIANYKAVRETFKMEPSITNVISALVITCADSTVDSAALKKSAKVLRTHVGILSEFRGQIKTPLICKMAISGDPEGYLQKIKHIYEILSHHKTFSNEYTIMAAVAICDHAPAQDPSRYINKTQDIFRTMKEEHRWLTSNEDISFAAVLALSGLDIRDCRSNAEECYAILREKLHGSNAVQTLAYILSLDSQTPDIKCQKALAILENLNETKKRYGMEYELAVLGALVLSHVNEEEIAELIVEAARYLREHHGFGNLFMEASGRTMLAAQLLFEALIKNQQNTFSAGASSPIAIAGEVSLLMCITTGLISTSISNSNDIS